MTRPSSFARNSSDILGWKLPSQVLPMSFEGGTDPRFASKNTKQEQERDQQWRPDRQNLQDAFLNHVR